LVYVFLVNEYETAMFQAFAIHNYTMHSAFILKGIYVNDHSAHTVFVLLLYTTLWTITLIASNTPHDKCFSLSPDANIFFL